MKMFLLGMLGMYFLLNFAILIALMTVELKKVRWRKEYLIIIRQIFLIMFFGVFLLMMENFN